MRKKSVLSVSLAAVAVILAVALCGCKESEASYKKKVGEMPIFKNTLAQAYPQNVVSEAVENFYKNPGLDANGNVLKKKVLFMGYDGCRADTLSLIGDEKPSAIKTLSETGGVWHSFSGGIENDKATKQATSTAPSWASIFTGVFGKDNGVSDNGQVKNTKYLNFTTKMVEQGKADGAVFNFSWDEHVHTYAKEIQYAKARNLKSDFYYAYNPDGLYQSEDDEVHAQNIAAVKGDVYDIITCTYECTDHAGHDTGFTVKNGDYVKAFYQEEEYAFNVINEVKARPTYAGEDWLIIITTDHGGNNTWHGRQTQYERLTWIACNKDLAALLG